MNSVTSNQYHRELALALDDSAMAQHHHNMQFGGALCLQYWAAPLNNGRADSVHLPPGVIQLIHCLTVRCTDSKSPETKCFCIKEAQTDDKHTVVQYFIADHTKGQCPHRTY